MQPVEAVDGRLEANEAGKEKRDAQCDAEQNEEGGLDREQAEDGDRPRANRTQDRHFAAPLIQRGEDHCHHSEQCSDDDHSRDDGEGRLGGADQSPQLL